MQKLGGDLADAIRQEINAGGNRKAEPEPKDP